MKKNDVPAGFKAFEVTDIQLTYVQSEFNAGFSLTLICDEKLPDGRPLEIRFEFVKTHMLNSILQWIADNPTAPFATDPTVHILIH